MKPKIAIWLLSVSGIALFAFGCGKKSQSANTTPTPTAQTAPASVSPVPPANSAAQSAAVPADGVAAPDLVPLTQALHIYTFQHKSMPKSFAELVAAGYVKNIPPLPPGKKLEISPTSAQVIMVNQ